MARLKHALGSDDATGAFHDLAASLGASMALRDLGMPEDGIGRAVDRALKKPYWNPRPLDRDGIGRLIADAWAGMRP